MGVKLVSLVTVLAVLEVSVFGAIVGWGRGRYGVPAPATSGDPTWERLNRIHLNSVEQLVMFVPLLWAFASSVNQTWATILGVVYILARIVYATGYARAPEARAAGAITTIIVQSILGLGALAGLVTQIIRA